MTYFDRRDVIKILNSNLFEPRAAHAWPCALRALRACSDRLVVSLPLSLRI